MKQKNMVTKLLGVSALAMMMALFCGLLLPVTGHADDVPPAVGSTENTTVVKPYTPANPNRFLRLTVKQTGPKINLKWDRMAEASAYKIYGGYTGESMKCLKTIRDNKVNAATLKKMNKMLIERTRVFKFKLLAYQNVNGQEVLMVKSPAVYVAGSQHPSYTNVKKLKVAKQNFTLAAGQKAKIKASVTRERKKKKFLPSICGPKVSYFSSNKSVATVDGSGNITAVAPGNCTVFVYTVNGTCKRVLVTVQ